MGYDHHAIRTTIERALRDAGVEPRERVRDIAFHMTDWLEDLDSWHQFCASPSSYDVEAVGSLLHRFLIHVPNHLAAASKLLTDISVSDVFGVGATTEGAD